jgi:hypothetical protein
MSSQTSGNFPLPYPLSTDPVNVHGDIAILAQEVSETLDNLDLSIIQISVINDESFELVKGTPVYVSSYDGGTKVKKALASTTKPILGLLKQTLQPSSAGVVVVAGVLQNINTSSYSAGSTLYVGALGGLVAEDNSNLKPSDAGGAVGIVAKSHATSGTIIVEAKGNGTWGALKNGLS